jgi:L-ribulose-5-phosphate 3-epimerase
MDYPMKKQLPIGIYEKALPYHIAWRERLALAREAGFDFVEMSVDESDERLARLDWDACERAELREAVAATGVPILTLCLSAHRKWALGSASPDIRECGLEIMRKAVEFCADTGIRTIQLAGYYVYYEPHDAGSMERYQDGLAQGLEWACRADVMLALENVDGNDIDSISKAMIFVDQFNSPWFQVYPDVGNLGEHGLDVCAELERGRGHLVGIHVKDTRPGEPRRVPFGQGIVPFVDAFRKLAEMRYAGPVMLEMWNDDSPDAMRIVRESREWVMARMVEAGLVRN